MNTYVSEEGMGMKPTSANIIKRIIKDIVFSIVAFIILMHSIKEPMLYDLKTMQWEAEFPSVCIPTISLQYRGSILSNERDLEYARKDFPELFENVYCFSDLKASRLIVISENKWLPYYFPVYSFLCIPIKVILQICGLPQDRCFTMTNAVLFIIALFFIGYVLDASEKYRIVTILIFLSSPIIYYINLVSYETCMFTLVTIGLVLYRKKKYASSLLLISLSSTINNGIIGVEFGLVTIFIINIVRKHNCRLKEIEKRELLRIMGCFLCCSPTVLWFIFQKVYIGGAFFSKFVDWKWLLGRINTYLL